ncbi:sigma-70 family RNA polymerase sigma factor [Pedobacter aquatilis]|uniref:sigma-70 family RNA polymerase sigma factor n=1 Tax=Pedobacter aquatilis TaxID=351343 RepID=UPI00293123AC|nr:sigma-70 family RNA polymerase sigma factor [Pedobacter aquatilis]
MNRLKSGDVSAYEKIYLTYSKELLAHAYKKTGDKVIAQELVQNIFISLWEKRETAEIKEIKNYLYGSLKFGIINHIRAEVIANKYIEYEKIAYRQNSDDTANIVGLKDLTEIIEFSLNSLPSKTQEVFRLSRYSHQSVKDISNDLNISEKAVEYHITRSLKRIKEHLKNFYVFFVL